MDANPITVVDALGSWVAGLGSLTAAGVALWLAKRVEKVKLDAWVGHRLLFSNGQTTEHLTVSVTNKGERPVTVVSLSWSVGRGKNRRVCIQTFPPTSPSNFPKKIEYGDTATFMLDFPQWLPYFRDGFLEDVSSRAIRTLRLTVHTSVSDSAKIVPEPTLLDKLTVD